MKLLKELIEGIYAKDTIKVPVLKPRDPNQDVLANKKNAAGPMKDKKKAMLNGEPKHKKDIYEQDPDGYVMPKTGDRVEYDNYSMWKNDLPKKYTTFRTEAKIEYAQTIGKELEGISGKWNMNTNSGWIYEYYLDSKNLREAKIIKAKEPGWYVVDHMDKPVEGPMQEGAARRRSVEMSKSKSKREDIPAFDVLYFTEYDIRQMNEEQISEKWNDSGASDAEGRWSKYAKGELGVGAMATWLYNSRVHKKTKAEKLKSAYGAIAQQENTSKLISSAKANALRAELKKKHSVNEAHI